ncbi:MAG: dienelactone hydrolase family protein [Kiritimatiellae bacterium]|nr:dienelactone hydrolase family protein [Kiritimatiellia bacterium]MDD5521732.1 dienelactone hydrolase family protein [Kiritimatiellia bacterium]
MNPKEKVAISPAIVLAVLLSFTATSRADEKSQTLSGTRLLDWTDDLSVRIIDEAHHFLDRKLAESIVSREKLWSRDFSSKEAYEKSIEPNREHFKKSIGVVEQRLPVVMERYGDDSNPALVAETDRYQVYQVRWPVLNGVCGEGLLLEPKRKPVAYVVTLPDADQTPEQIAGMAEGVEPSLQFARRFAESGFEVVVPVLINRACDFSGNPEIRMTNQPHREWIHRQAFEMGRHLIGYEVQKVQSVVDWFQQVGGPDARIGVVGYGEGGLIAFYSAAVDKRIEACLVSGYFDSRQKVWEEPIYRNVWNLLREFGDAEIATLIAPRLLLIEHSVVPKVDGPPPVTKDRRGAAPGRLTTPSIESVRGELARASALDKVGMGQRRLVEGTDGQPVGPVSEVAVKTMAEAWKIPCEINLSTKLPGDNRKTFDAQARQKRQVEQLTTHIQIVQRKSDWVRDKWFLKKTDRKSVETFTQDTQKYREIFRNEVIGSFDDSLLPLVVRTRKIYDEPKWTGYDVVMDVWPELHAWGILCLPKDIKAGEKRPVVVCQHGLSGVPRDVIEKDVPAARAYHAFAAALAERGFVTFAPFNLYRNQDYTKFNHAPDYARLLQRKANPLRASLFSIIARQHEQILNWLGSLQFVDKTRIGFYGLSYGGYSAMRLPALLDGYVLSICSANFNDWPRKTISLDLPVSYIFTGEWEQMEFDLGHTFNYAEMAYLIFPRPFMVERGHNDSAGIDSWVASEYGKIRYLYNTMGLGDRTEIEYFNGGHEIHSAGTFRFLHKHLNWPEPAAEKAQ